MATLDCCAAGPGDRVYHHFDLMVDDSLPYARRIRYRYGDLGESEKPIAKSNGVSIAIIGSEMTVPENFEVSWETPDGKRHQAVVPVRSRIHPSLKGKSVLFLILYDEVRGYVSTQSPTGEQRERFY